MSPDAGYADMLGFDFDGAQGTVIRHSVISYDPEDPPRTPPIKYRIHSDDWCAMAVTCDEVVPELVTYLGIGSHLKNLPPGSSPKKSEYWFEGALIVLAEHLGEPGVLEKNILRLTKHRRDQCIDDNRREGIFDSRIQGGA